MARSSSKNEKQDDNDLKRSVDTGVHPSLDGKVVVFLDRILKPLLKLKQGGVLEKHHCKGAHQAVRDIVKSRSIARVGALGKAPGEDFTKARKPDVLFDMQVANPNISTIYRWRLPYSMKSLA